MALVALGGMSLAACGSISEKFAHTMAEAPAIGLPKGVPERPATPAAYPAVHDMPPARPAVLTSDQQIKMEDELVAARKQQQDLAGQPTAPPPAVAAPAPAPAKTPQPAAKTASKKTPPAAPAASAAPKTSTGSIY